MVHWCYDVFLVLGFVNPSQQPHSRNLPDFFHFPPLSPWQLFVASVEQSLQTTWPFLEAWPASRARFRACHQLNLTCQKKGVVCELQSKENA